MANEVGTTLLNSLTNSTFDIGNMAKVLAEADVAGPRNILENSREKSSTELDALKYLQANLEAFNTYVTDLSSPDLFAQKTATSANESIVSVTTSDNATVGSYQIESRQLAQAHTQVANKVFGSPSDTISTGNLSISVAGQAQTIAIDASNNTMEGLQKVINNGDYGVTASIINNGSGYQMMFTAKETGASSEVSISGLSDFDTDGFTVTSEAQDAVMVINGLTVTSADNTFDEVIEGISFELKGIAPGSPGTVSIDQDQETVKEAITSFVDVYNQLDTILDELGSYDSGDLTEEELESEEYAFYGDLAGSSLLRSVQADVKSALSGAIDEFGGNFRTLADLGLSFDREGVMQVDSERLDEVLTNNMDAVSSLFSKGGVTSDALINVIGGSDKTQTGEYTLDITQQAERAVVTGGASTATTDQRLAGDKIIDSTAALTIDAGASFNLTIGATTQAIDLSTVAGSYSTKDEVATQIQAQIDAAFGSSLATIAYDSSQARYEITAAAGQGSVSLDSAINLLNQGFSTNSYVGSDLIDLASDATFNAKVDTSTASAVTIAAGRYTEAEFAKVMADSINANADVQAADANVSVTANAGTFSVSSSRFGVASSIELTGFTNLANAGFTTDLTDVGQNVDGTITTASGSLNLGAYADFEDGRKIKISDFAVIGTEAAEVRGLEFEILGGNLGARGPITYAEGFASQLEATINELFDNDTGLVTQRIDGLNDKMDGYAEKEKSIDARYEKLLLKYQMQFSMLQSLISSSEQTRDMLSATFNPQNN